MLAAEVQIDGEWLSGGSTDDFRLELFCGDTARAAVTNNSGRSARLGGFRFSGFEFPCRSGRDIRVFREGWCMPTPCGSRRCGESDYPVSDGYRQFCVSDPERYECRKPNRFSAEYVTVLNDRATGENMLAGFVSSGSQFTRWQIELDESGLKELSGYCFCDGITLDPGETVFSEKLCIMHGSDAWRLLGDFAAQWGACMNVRIRPQTPKGWCSWYYYFEKVTESDIEENLDYALSHREDFPVEYFQIDDGYQTYLGDWLAASEKFPHGVQSVLKKIAAKGGRPGLWLAPFSVEKGSVLLAQHPDWMIHDAAGEIIYPAQWRGNPMAVLDATHPEVYGFLKGLFRSLRESGCEYVKLDFVSYEVCTPGGVYFDRKMTRAQALRRGFEAIREGVGEEVFILACTAPLGAVCGIADACRISTDITPYWGREADFANAESMTVPNVCRNVINRLYMHRRLWINDPDVHIARTDRNELSENEIRLWTTVLWLAGGLAFTADRFSTLAPARAELCKLLLAQSDCFDSRPLDLFDREVPSVWRAERRSDGAVFAGVFNFSDTECCIFVPLAELFGGGAVLTDYWTGVQYTSDAESVMVLPHSCLLLCRG